LLRLLYFAIVLVPAARQLNNNKRRGNGIKEVDEQRETSHNLISLLLTNKTIRQAQQAVPNTVL
jgi:hypothetical protein